MRSWDNWIGGFNADACLLGGIFIATIPSNSSKFNLGAARRAKMHAIEAGRRRKDLSTPTRHNSSV